MSNIDKSKVLLFSEYRKQQALFIQQELTKGIQGLRVRDYRMLELYLEYLDIYNFDKRATEEINALGLDFKLNPKYISYTKEAVENHIDWVDGIIKKFLK